MSKKVQAPTMSGPACLDLLTMARTWPAAEWVEAPSAELWAFAAGDIHGLHGTACEKITEGPDVYTLIDDAYGLLRDVTDVRGVALVTWGWAAPINPATGEPDGAPSQHAERRRVRLVAVATAEGVTSRITFRDDEDNPVDDCGEARGPLAEAIADLWESVSA